MFEAEGPGILSFNASPYSVESLRVSPPVDVRSGVTHVLLQPGPQTMAIGQTPGSTATALTVDDVKLLPLSFDPVAALDGAPPLVVSSGTPAAEWPFVLTGGESGIRLSMADSLNTAGSGPARVAWRADTAVTTSFSGFVAPPPLFANRWDFAGGSLWLDRDSTVRFTSYFIGAQQECRLSAAPATSFPEAQDVSGLTFSPSAGVLAHALPEGSVSGGDAVAFALGTSPRSLTTQVTGPGKLRFWWRRQTPQQNAITCRPGSGAIVSYDSPDWKQAELAVPTGLQSIGWTVSANFASAKLDALHYFPQWTFAARAAQTALASVPVASRATDDSDGDSTPGLLEFAFGLDPCMADSALFTGSITGPENARGLPVHRLTRAPDGLYYLEFQFPRRVSSGLTYQLQATSGLTTAWENAGTLEVLRPLGPDWELCSIRDPQPLDPTRPRRLVRLRVTQP